MDDENIDEAEKNTNECEEVVVDNTGDNKEVCISSELTI